MHLDPTVIALIGTLCGGVGLKLAEAWLGRKQIRIDHAGRIRDEQRSEIMTLKAENTALEKSVDEWRGRYYSAYERLILIKSQLTLHGLAPPDDDE